MGTVPFPVRVLRWSVVPLSSRCPRCSFAVVERETAAADEAFGSALYGEGGEAFGRALRSLFALRRRPARDRAHRLAELVGRARGHNVAVNVSLDEIIGGADLVGGDDWEPLCEPLVHDESPRLGQRWDHEHVRL